MSECFGLNRSLYKNRTDLQIHTNGHITLLLPCHRTIHWQLGTITLNGRYKGSNFANIDQALCVYIFHLFEHLQFSQKAYRLLQLWMVHKNLTVHYLGLTMPDRLYFTSGSVHCSIQWTIHLRTIMVAGNFLFATFRSHLSCLKITRVWKFLPTTITALDLSFIKYWILILLIETHGNMTLTKSAWWRNFIAKGGGRACTFLFWPWW